MGKSCVFGLCNFVELSFFVSIAVDNSTVPKTRFGRVNLKFTVVMASAFKGLYLYFVHLTNVGLTEVGIVGAVPEDVLDILSLPALATQVRIHLPCRVPSVGCPQVTANDAL